MSTADVARWGGKGAALIRLRAAGFEVPEFVVVPTEEYAEVGLGETIDSQWGATLRHAQRTTDGVDERASAAIRRAFAAAPIATGQRERLTRLVAPLLDSPAAVRSSATAEDLPRFSFAGQQDTFLNVTGLPDVLRAVVDCWSSIWSARAIGYRRRHGFDHATVATAVVVQRMVDAAVSGVLFTANPRTGRRDDVVIEATAGLGEALDDLWFLHLDELRDAFDHDRSATIRMRRQTWAAESRRTRIPRVLVSDGRALHEGLGGAGDLVGSGVSPGVVAGTARIVREPRDARLEPGDILVCPGTDPAWTPLFLIAGGLITEVGGLMTHGSVLARECGIPAVVGVDDATHRLIDGQRVRLDGTSGVIEVLAG